MGYKKIEEKRKELRQKQEVKYAFRDAVGRINEGLANIQKAISDVEHTKQELGRTIAGLDTGGIKEFEDYKKSLLAICNGWGVRPLPLAPVEKVCRDAEAELRAMIAAWTDKLAAAFPKEVKPGMTFKNQSLDRIYEVLSPPEQAANANLKGDNAIFFKVKWWKADGEQGGGYSISLVDLKKMKYLNT